MQELTDFHFLRPWWLLALLPLFVLVAALYRQRRAGIDWERICDPGLLPHVLIGKPAPGARRPLWLLVAGGVPAILALAGPAWEKLPAPVFRNVSALVIVLDLSVAMDAADLKPSRLERARYKIADILRERKDGQTALLVYGGDAFTVTPLTDDSATIGAQLSALSTALMPAQGARVDLGLQAAERLLKQAGLTGGDILLVTAGERAGAAADTARRLRAGGYRLSVLGVGTAEGAPVPLAEGGFLKDDRGRILVPRLDADPLRNLAETGGGLYRGLSADAGDVEALLRFVDRRTDPDRQAGNPLNIDQWRERGPWLLLPVLPLAALAFRRGWLGAWLLILVLPVPDCAEAFEWRDLWKTPDQQARQAFEAGQAEQAAERFRNPEWKAAAEYKAGRYAEAAETLQDFDTAESRYNQGNALARQGRYQEALSAYERALALDPNHQDARYNRDLVRKALEKQQQEQQQPQSDPSESSSRDGQNRGDKGERSQRDPSSNDGESAANDSQGQDPQDASPANGSEEKNRETGRKDQGEQTPEPGEAGNGAERQPQAGKEKNKDEAETAPGESGSALETRQAEEQWLRRIPDDPGGLLKRKFYYQYRQRQQPREAE
jgi:Ca-activated chloride channel family protein